MPFAQADLTRPLSVGFKSPATISQNQTTVTYDGTSGVLATRGRHDPCVVPRAVPIVEAMAALVIIDALLAQDARSAAAARLPREPVMALPKSMRLESKIKAGGNAQGSAQAPEDVPKAA